MKKYILTLAKHFPLSHYRAGTPTEFKEKFLNGEKIHTIRSNYNLWKSRIQEVQKGNAVISIRQWSDKPYRSEQITIAELNKENGVGIEKISLPSIGGLGLVLKLYPDLDKNDGLSRLDWMNWFEHYERNKPMAIIHFTPFRYTKSSNACRTN